MSERDQVLGRIYALLDEQVRALRSELSVNEILEYGGRKRQIASLINQLDKGSHSP